MNTLSRDRQTQQLLRNDRVVKGAPPACLNVAHRAGVSYKGGPQTPVSAEQWEHYPRDGELLFAFFENSNLFKAQARHGLQIHLLGANWLGFRAKYLCKSLPRQQNQNQYNQVQLAVKSGP
jgi:hypothetical protein